MSFIQLEVRSENFDCDIEFDRHLVVIKGESGVGKTSLVDLLSVEDPDVAVKCTLKIQVLPETGWDILVKNSSDTLFIVDDALFVETVDFHKYYNTAVTRNNYFMIICRAEFNFKNTSKLSFSSNDIYNFKAKGKYHYIEYAYSMPSITTSEIQKVDKFNALLNGTKYSRLLDFHTEITDKQG